MTHTKSLSHFFTVDVEEYFQVQALKSAVPRADWLSQPSRVEASIHALLATLDRYNTKATFFVLGWIAEHRPQVVRAITNAGHEIASHGYWHERVTSLDQRSFRADIRSSKQILEDVAGAPVVGYRAPSFSIIPGLEWCFDILVEEGYRYDSSLFPMHRSGYGYPNAPRFPYIIERPAGRLAEFPLATTTLFNFPVPAAGGGYLRQFPMFVIRRAFQEATARSERATFYIHPWEMDPDQPRMKVSLLTRIRHYRGLRATHGRIEQLLREFSFGPIMPHLRTLGVALQPSIEAGAA